jgi:hypothetical protein
VVHRRDHPRTWPIVVVLAALAALVITPSLASAPTPPSHPVAARSATAKPGSIMPTEHPVTLSGTVVSTSLNDMAIRDAAGHEKTVIVDRLTRYCNPECRDETRDVGVGAYVLASVVPDGAEYRADEVDSSPIADNVHVDAIYGNTILAHRVRDYAPEQRYVILVGDYTLVVDPSGQHSASLATMTFPGLLYFTASRVSATDSDPEVVQAARLFP